MEVVSRVLCMAAEMEIVESSLVAPNEETPKHSIWLSNIDLILMFYFPTVYFYRPNGASDFFSVEAMRASLARALVAFYPLAGRLGTDCDGRPEIDCTGEGVLFTVARSEGCIDDFGDFSPSPEMRRLLVPSPESSENSTILLMIQVTFFKCGGVAIGMDMQHAAADGRSFFNFVNHWCNLTKGISELAVPPFFDRTALRSRSPPSPCQPEKFVFGPNYSTPAVVVSANVTTDEPCASAVLELSGSQVDALKRKSEQQSTFQAVMAQAWRCACIARRLAPDRVTKFISVGEIRTRLKPALPPGFFGNAVCRTEAAVSTVGEIVSNPVGFAARKIGGTIAGLTDEHARSVIDRMEVEGKGGRFDHRDRRWLRMSEANVCGSSLLGLWTEKADFGWGKSEYMGRAATISGSGKVYIFPGKVDDGGVSVLVSLETKNMDRFKELFYKDLAVGKTLIQKGISKF